MAIIITRDASFPQDVWGGDTAVFGSFELTGNYATGGYLIDLSQLGFQHCIRMIVEGKAGLSFEYIESTKMLKVYTGSGAVTSGSTSGGTPSQATGASVALSSDSAGTPSQATGVSVTNNSSAVTGNTSDVHTQLLNATLGSTGASNENVDGVPLGAPDIAAPTAVALGAWAHGALTNPDICRNAFITINNPTGGPLNLFEGVMTFTVTGTDIRGNVITDLITFTSTGANKAVAAGAARNKLGVKAFATVTNITLDNVPDDALDISAGVGHSVAILNPLFTPAEADVLAATITGAPYVFTGLIDTVNNTIDYTTIAPADVLGVTYLTASGRTGTAAAQTNSVVQATYNALGNHTHTPTTTQATYNALAGHTHSVAAAAADEYTNGAALALSDISFIAIGKGM